MASEVFSAREASASALNGTGGGRSVPRLYGAANTEKYPKSISLGLSTRDETAQKDKIILDSVLGQLSDGMWENSRAMEKYWNAMTFSQDEKGGVELRYASSYTEKRQKWTRYGLQNVYDYKYSGYNGMSSRDARDFFAKKIKQVVDSERKHYPETGKWSADNHNKLEFMHEGVTVADAYSLYKRLKR